MFPSCGSSDLWNHMNEHLPISKNFECSVPMYNILKINYQEVGNSCKAGFLEPPCWRRTQQKSPEWRYGEGRMSHGTASIYGYNMPLPSASTEELTSLQFKKAEIPAAKDFSSGPSSQGQKKMALFGNMGGEVGGWGNRAATLEIAARVPAIPKKRMARPRKPHVNIKMKTKPPPEHALRFPLQSQRPQHRDYYNHIDAQEIEQEINKEDLKFLLQKELRNSDVNSLKRIVIPKKEAEAHLPPLSLGQKIGISMVDMDTLQTWTFRYRFWPNNKTRMYILEKTGDFVKSHDLERGDSIIVYKDNTNGIYVIKGQKASIDEDALGNSRERNGLCTSLNVIKGGNQQSAHDMDYKEIINKSSYRLSAEAFLGGGHSFVGVDHSTVLDTFATEPGTYFVPGNPNSPKLESIRSFGPDDIHSKEIIDQYPYQLSVEDVAAYTHAFIGADQSTEVDTFATDVETYFQHGNSNSPKLESIPSFGPVDMDYKEKMGKSPDQLTVEADAAYTEAFIVADHSFATELGTYLQTRNPNSPKLESIPSFGPDDIGLDNMILDNFLDDMNNFLDKFLIE